MQQIRDGLTILMKYSDPEDCCGVSSEHDEMMAGTTEGISEEDAQALEDLGWMRDDDHECWSHFT